MEKTVVLYPSAGIGHIIPLVELGKQIIKNHPSFTVTILIVPINPKSTSQTSPYIKQISETNPSIIFHHLPPPSTQYPPETSDYEILSLTNPLIKQTLESISKNFTISAFIFDFFCSSSLQVSTQLGIPSYVYFTSGANILSVLLYLPILFGSRDTHEEIANLEDKYVEIPGLPPMLATDVPSLSLPRSHMLVQAFLFISETATKVKGIIVNTFESFEPRAFKAIREGLCVPDSLTPPVYSIGPLISEPAVVSDEVECLKWLDSQPRQSVVFLCFGSGGIFSTDQLKEIAVGLEKSGQRFLWVVRDPLKEEERKGKLASNELDLTKSFDLTDLLPEGFLDRTRDRGLVVKNWAPQVEVLNRESIGGFVTHCGWNSILESVLAGVPMIGWPLYAEQHMNRAILVDEMKLSLYLNHSDGFVTGSEIEEQVRMLMESEEGKEIRDRVLVARDEAKSALSVGGSSINSLAELVELWGSV